MRTDGIDLFSYECYRNFLKDYVELKKTELPSFSIGQFAKNAGLKDTSSINKVIRGQRSPGPELLEKLSLYFKFEPKEFKYFNDLVQLDKAPLYSKQRKYIQERLAKNNPSNGFSWLDDAQFESISNWYTFTIRELIKLKSFKNDIQYIKAALDNKVGEDEIEQSLSNLKSLGLIEQSSDGSLNISKPRYRTTSEVPSKAIRNYHKGVLSQAIEHIEDTPVELRHYVASTLAVKKENIPEAKKLIDDFLDSFSKLTEDQGEGADEVYQVNIQFFPTTKVQ